jgi:hypothetical protein
MTSVIKETGSSGQTLPLAAVRAGIARRFAAAYGRHATQIDADALDAALDDAVAEPTLPAAVE